MAAASQLEVRQCKARVGATNQSINNVELENLFLIPAHPGCPGKGLYNGCCCFTTEEDFAQTAKAVAIKLILIVTL